MKQAHSGPSGAGPAEGGFDPGAFNAFEAAGWEQRAAGYDAFVGNVTSKLVGPLLTAAAVAAGTRTLDVATGPGYAAAGAADLGASVVGIDVASAMVDLARRRCPGVAFIEAEAEAVPFADASFDSVVGNLAILHFGRPEQAVAEFVRVLRPGGRLALTTWDEPGRMRLVGVFLDAINEAQEAPLAGAPAGPPFFQFANDERFATLLSDQGLTEVEVRAIAFDHPVASADELWAGLLAGTVRTSALVQGQADDTQRRIRAAFDRILGQYRRDERFELPVSVKLAVGRKAS
jgi:ubiquinone/menaquinone biosynthesis C-methylase UbiE